MSLLRPCVFYFYFKPLAILKNLNAAPFISHNPARSYFSTPFYLSSKDGLSEQFESHRNESEDDRASKSKDQNQSTITRNSKSIMKFIPYSMKQKIIDKHFENPSQHDPEFLSTHFSVPYQNVEGLIQMAVRFRKVSPDLAHGHGHRNRDGLVTDKHSQNTENDNQDESSEQPDQEEQNKEQEKNNKHLDQNSEATTSQKPAPLMAQRLDIRTTAQWIRETDKIWLSLVEPPARVSSYGGDGDQDDSENFDEAKAVMNPSYNMYDPFSGETVGQPMLDDDDNDNIDDDLDKKNKEIMDKEEERLVSPGLGDLIQEKTPPSRTSWLFLEIRKGDRTGVGTRVWRRESTGNIRDANRHERRKMIKHRFGNI